MMAGLHLEQPNIKLTWAALKHSRPKGSRHGRSRLIQPHQLIHASVAFKSRPYEPNARFSSEFGVRNWAALIGRRTVGEIPWPAEWNNILEMHLFGPSAAEIAVAELRQGILQDVDPLSVYVSVWSCTYTFSLIIQYAQAFANQGMAERQFFRQILHCRILSIFSLTIIPRLELAQHMLYLNFPTTVNKSQSPSG